MTAFLLTVDLRSPRDSIKVRDVTISGGLTGRRGSVAVTASMEKFQDGVLGAMAAAAGCYLEKPEPDPGIDWVICHNSAKHTVVRTAKLEVALKCTYQTAPNTSGEFSFTLENPHLRVLNESLIVFPRVLIVMLVPRDVDAWLYSRNSWTIFRHSMYWVNLKGHTVSGRDRTNVRVPFGQKLDSLELCRMLENIGNGRPI